MKYLLPFLLGFTLMLAFQGTVRSHPQDHAQLHEEFYKYWRVPAPGTTIHRQGSCCNNKDCYPTATKHEHGRWFFMHRETQRWMVMPEGKLEHNQPDPRESPDGQSHVCADYGGRVICAVMGSGI